MKVISSTHASRVNMDTTPQTKAIGYPTEPRQYDRLRERLVARARVVKAGCCAHAWQMRRSKACTQKLRNDLGLVIREVERQGAAEVLTRLLTLC